MVDTSEERYVVISETVVSRVVGRETVLLDTATGRYFALDDMGTRVWAALTAEPSVGRVCEALEREFESDAAQLRGDVEQLVGRLAEQGLVEVRSAKR